jgi:hypothetical protein
LGGFTTIPSKGDSALPDKPKLPANAPVGAYCQMNNGIFVDDMGQEVPRPVDPRKKPVDVPANAVINIVPQKPVTPPVQSE